MGREARAREEARRKRKSEGHKIPSEGLSGHPERLLIQNVFVDGDPRNGIAVGGGPGQYRVTFTLMRPNYAPIGEYEYSFKPDIEGDSHLAIAPPALSFGAGNPTFDAIKIYSTTDDGQIVFIGRKNDNGFLARLETQVEAKDFRNAEEKAHRALVPSLSNLSAQLDIPLTIWRMLIVSVETESQQISIITPYEATAFGLLDGGKLSKEFRSFAGLYREAIQSNSSVYQFLCFFKIAEGVNQRRRRLAEEAKAHGQAPSPRRVERVPEKSNEYEPWLNAIFPGPRKWTPMALDSIFVTEAKDRKFNDVLGKELADLRNDVAHTLSDAGGEFNVSTDDLLHVARVDHWLPLMKCIVRRMLKNEFPGEYLSFLPEPVAAGVALATATVPKTEQA